MAKTTHLGGIAAIAFALLSGSASAEDVSMKSGADKDFVTKVNYANIIEIETSKLARDKATSPELKAFAIQMIDDHTKAQASLEKVVRDVDGPELGQSLDGSHMQMLDNLSKREGPDFDKLYVQDQIALHDTALQVLTEYIQNGKVVALKTFAERTLPVVETHRKHIGTLADAHP